MESAIWRKTANQKNFLLRHLFAELYYTSITGPSSFNLPTQLYYSSNMMSTTQPNLDSMIDSILYQINIYKNNLTHQVNETFTRLTPKDLIRLVIIVGAYSFLRPYLLKLGARFQAKDHEREIDHEEIQEMRKSEGYNNSSLKVDIHEDTDSEDEATTRTGSDWGKTARRRQRRVMRQLLEAEEKKRLEDEEAESDKELEQFMIS